MTNREKILLRAIIIVPIVICAVVLKSIWSEEDDTKVVDNNISAVVSDEIVYQSGDEIISGDDINNISSGEVMTMGGEEYVSTIGSPISKIYTNAVISVSSANVYLNSDESSEILGSFTKDTTVTAHKYPEGWSRVSGNKTDGTSLSGWTKTSNIVFPDDEGSTLGSVIGKEGTVTAEPYLNIRVTPSASATKVGEIKKGEKITIDDVLNGWYKVTVNGVTGWVSSDYVTIN